MKAPAHDRCRALLGQLSRFVDGDLDGVERRTMVMHLKQCPCCEELAESLQRTVEACHQAGRSRLPADVRRRARARIAAMLAAETDPHGRS